MAAQRRHRRDRRAQNSAGTGQISGDRRTGDFDGDGDSDIVWRDDDAGVLSWELENGEFAAEHSLSAAPHNWQIAGTGDFDGDGDDDIVWRHKEGAVTIWEMEDGAYVINHNQPMRPTTWRSRVPVISMATAMTTSCGAMRRGRS